jgi:flagellar export protein FliJ
MKFRFALAAVLRVRHIREDQQRNLLLAANVECDRIRRQLAAVEQDQSQRSAMVSRQIATGIWGAELQFDSDCRRQAKILRERILLQLQEATKHAGQEREKYLSLRRDRRAMETLRDSARQQFEGEQRRKEQLGLDEIHLLSRGRAQQNLPSD